MAWRVRATQFVATMLIVALLPLAGFCLMVAATAGPGGVAEGIASLVTAPSAPDWIG